MLRYSSRELYLATYCCTAYWKCLLWCPIHDQLPQPTISYEQLRLRIYTILGVLRSR